MKGFPRRGSNGVMITIPAASEYASMKGFPRRGSNPPASIRWVHIQTGLNEGLPQKGKQSGST